MDTENYTVEEITSRICELNYQEQFLEISKLELAFKKGQLLIELKERTIHGQFVNLLKNVVMINERKAQRFMQLAQNENVIKNALNDEELEKLTMDKAYKMIKKATKKITKKDLGSAQEIYKGDFETKAVIIEKGDKIEFTLSMCLDQMDLLLNPLNKKYVLKHMGILIDEVLYNQYNFEGYEIR